jgi:hypothetical protein
MRIAYRRPSYRGLWRRPMPELQNPCDCGCRHFTEVVMATKYGKTAQSKVKKTMHERKHGTLRSGTGKKVTSRKQAIAIGLSEARKAGAKVPKKK